MPPQTTLWEAASVCVVQGLQPVGKQVQDLSKSKVLD